MSDGVISFAKLLELKVNHAVQQRFNHQAVTPDLLRELRDLIRQQVDAVFLPSSYSLTAEARGWLANQMFSAVKINGETSIAELVIINEYKLAEMPYHDVKLLHDLFKKTAVGQLLEEECARRSAAP